MPETDDRRNITDSQLIEELQRTIREQKGQLALAFGVLVSLGFELDELVGAAA